MAHQTPTPEPQRAVAHPISILPAAAEAIPAILELTRAAFAVNALDLDPPSGVFAETPGDVATWLTEGVIFLAWEGGAPVGAARVRPAEAPDALYCGRLAVHPGHHGRGIGSALMESVEARARAEGYTAVLVGVRLQLPQNRRFFERRGYRFVADLSHLDDGPPTYTRLRKDLASRR